MTRYLRRGCGGLDRRLHLRARGTRPPAFEAVEGSSGRAMAIGASQPRVSPWLHDRHGVNIFVSAPYVGTGCRRAGPPPKAGPAQAAVDSATEAPESGWFLAYSSSLGRRVIGEIIPESCIHLCEEPQGGDDVPPLQGHPGLSDASEGTGVPESRGEVGVQDSEHHDGARDTRWRDDRMTGRRSHGRLSALNGVVHQGSRTPGRRAAARRLAALRNRKSL